MKFQLADFHIGIRQFTLIEIRKETGFREFTLFRVQQFHTNYYGTHLVKSWNLFTIRRYERHDYSTIAADIILFNRQFQKKRKQKPRPAADGDDLPF